MRTRRGLVTVLQAQHQDEYHMVDIHTKGSRRRVMIKYRMHTTTNKDNNNSKQEYKIY